MRDDRRNFRETAKQAKMNFTIRMHFANNLTLFNDGVSNYNKTAFGYWNSLMADYWIVFLESSEG